jgi:deoxyribodipyrimidine photolyase
MLDITSFFSGNDCVTIYQPGICNPDGKHILYWMQRAQRGYENAALNAAIALGNALDLPIVVEFVLTEFESANLHHYTFMLEGIAAAVEIYRNEESRLLSAEASRLSRYSIQPERFKQPLSSAMKVNYARLVPGEMN